MTDRAPFHSQDAARQTFADLIKIPLAAPNVTV